MPPSLIRWLDRVNAAHPWSHNDAYRRWVLRQVPPGPARVLDVGCGAGGLVRALAARGAAAHGVDVDAAGVATARALSAGHPGATFAVADALHLDAPAPGYDAVTAVAVLHHLPMAEALTRWSALLRPGGVLVVVGCYREATRRDRAVSALAVPVNLVVGLLRGRRSAAARVAMAAPTREPEVTLAEVRAVAARVLPGARVRRRLFWRYTLVHRLPG
ncbi:class I SAM-dependent methyltransferase [Cellulomonas sp. IC4_254]|uniref:class I SAM-dependent methyltransferase n=1 Tax=Cellulomonas sp. IC4_254 TaxID=2714040 RepID=UPI00142005D9|nr:class I SAM-dependent methyltransferase [Cellulomonas sp. IC4_254]NHT18374.1 class I SAM-dependent methyltransferase [Cellulomonas sp. IC4_254]